LDAEVDADRALTTGGRGHALDAADSAVDLRPTG
jgi:hypothetical protein